VAVVYSPPSEGVPIDILNRLHRYNRNLILIGDLNARHPSWHDVSSNSCSHQLAEWIDEKQNLKIFNSAKPTSIGSRATTDLINASTHVSSKLAEIDQKMRVTDHYPVYWRLSVFNSHNSTEYELKRIDWVVLNSILNLIQNFLFSLSLRADEA
jgi:Endonuclease-reverse transcriptase